MPSKRIAVFNHTDNVLKLFQRLLTKHGFDVKTYKQEIHAVQEVLKIQPDLILLGYLKGYVENEVEMIRELRANSLTAAIPIIVCSTGEVRIERDPIAGDIQYITFLQKPFRADELVTAVKTALWTGDDQAVPG